jgi:glycosyltransferase involved in cell wall biosynthesis
MFVVNAAWFFLSHRLPLARAAMAVGFDVHLASDAESDADRAQVLSTGIEFHEFGVARSGVNPLRELNSLRDLRRIMQTVRPDVVHNVSAKAIVYGTQAAHDCGSRGIVNAISGFGYAYTSGPRRRLLRGLMDRAYARSFRPDNVRVIVQNLEDRAEVLRLCPTAGSRIRLILGSGVDLTKFRPSPEPSGIPTVMLPARLLREKGIYEFAAAAAQLRHSGPEARFLVAGPLDLHNRGALTAAEMRELCHDTGLQWLGDDSPSRALSKDMTRCFQETNLVCLPSYREGAPKALMEASAAGRAIVTTDIPGCRDIVREGENGLLVPPRDATALASAIRLLIENPDLRRRMGLAGRVRAESEFGIERVVQRHLEIYRELLAGAAAAT